MKNTLHFLITSLADNADAVTIQEEESNGSVEYMVQVAKEDMGKVIGKEGRIIRALRNVMKIPAMKQNKRVTISLVDAA